MDWIREKHASSDELSIDRGGLFEALWRRYESGPARGPESEAVTHWDAPGTGQLYYRLVELGPREPVTESLLILYLDPWLAPPYLIEDYLRMVPSHPGPWTCLVKFGAFDLHQHAEYVHRVYGLLRRYVPQHGELQDLAALLKRLNFKGVQFFTPGLDWIFGDPWIVHLLLSRGASRWRTPLAPCLTVKQTRQLSDHHGLEIGELETGGHRFDVEILRRMSGERGQLRTTTNSLGIPDSFLSLSYRNIYRSV